MKSAFHIFVSISINEMNLDFDRLLCGVMHATAGIRSIHISMETRSANTHKYEIAYAYKHTHTHTVPWSTFVSKTGDKRTSSAIPYGMDSREAWQRPGNSAAHSIDFVVTASYMGNMFYNT